MSVGKRVCAIVLSIVLLALPLAEASANTSVSFKPAWKESETAKYTVVKSRTRNGKTNSATSTFTLTVLQKTDEGYVFEWRCDDIEFDMNLPADYRAYLVDVARGMRIKYATDRYGAYVEVVNRDEVRAWMKASAAQLIPRIPDEKMRDSIGKYLDGISQNDTFINYVIAKEITFLHNPYFYGQVFDVNETYFTEVSLMNAFNPEQPFAGMVYLVATRSDGFRHMTIRQEIDKEKSAAILQDTLKKMAVALSGQQPGQELTLTSVDIRDVFRYSFSEAGNWVEKGATIRTIAIDGMTMEDKVEFIRRQ